MGQLKRTLFSILTLCCVAGLVACGGESENSISGGNGSSVEAGTEKGEQVTREEWTAAVTNSFAAENVTAYDFLDMRMEEVWESEHVVYVGTGERIFKLANNVSHDIITQTYTVNGLAEDSVKETYNYVNEEGGIICEWERRSADDEWEYNEYSYNENAGMFDGTLGKMILGDEWEKRCQEWIAFYDQLQYDESTGEYTWMEDGEDSCLHTCKILNGKFYTLTWRWEDTEEESPTEFGYTEEKYVFKDYGTTTVELPKDETPLNSEN